MVFLLLVAAPISMYFLIDETADGVVAPVTTVTLAGVSCLLER